MALISYHYFETVLQALTPGTIGLVETAEGLDAAVCLRSTQQLLNRFSIKNQLLSTSQLHPDKIPDAITSLVVLGPRYPADNIHSHTNLQDALSRLNKNLILAPQSLIRSDAYLDGYQAVYTTDSISQERHPQANLAADWRLAFETRNHLSVAHFTAGLFLRQDDAGRWFQTRSLGDPALLCNTPEAALHLLSRFDHITTDSIVSAILGLCARKKVTLIASKLDYEHAFYVDQLKILNCHWRDSPEALACQDDDIDLIENILWKHLLPASPTPLPWHCQLKLEATASFHDDIVTDELSGQEFVLNSSASDIVQRARSGHTLAQIVDALSIDYEIPPLTAAYSVQSLSQTLIADQIAAPHWPNSTQQSAWTTIRRNSEIRVSVNPLIERDGHVIASADLLQPNASEREIWFSLPVEYSNHIADTADAFVLSTLWLAMQQGVNVAIDGAAISDGLIDNLFLWQQQWVQQLPTLLRVAKINADKTSKPNNSGQGTMSRNRSVQSVLFDGNVDSTYTLSQHMTQLAESHASLIVVTPHGFSIPLDEADVFQRTLMSMASSVSDSNASHIPVSTNIRSLTDQWDWYHGSAYCAILTLLNRQSVSATIASTLPPQCKSIWGSHAQIDRLMSTDRFVIQHHGDDTPRLAKLQILGQNPDSLLSLHVCEAHHTEHRNCGTCLPCVMLQINLHALDLPLDCIDQPLSEDALSRALPIDYPGELHFSNLLDVNDYCLLTNKTTVWSRQLAANIEQVMAPAYQAQV